MPFLQAMEGPILSPIPLLTDERADPCRRDSKPFAEEGGDDNQDGRWGGCARTMVLVGMLLAGSLGNQGHLPTGTAGQDWMQH